MMFSIVRTRVMGSLRSTDQIASRIAGVSESGSTAVRTTKPSGRGQAWLACSCTR